jgi:hypothetical protein
MTQQEFRQNVKRDKTHYTSLNDGNYFNLWNRGFVATAFMHHTCLVLDEIYIPTTATNMQSFERFKHYAIF